MPPALEDPKTGYRPSASRIDPSEVLKGKARPLRQLPPEMSPMTLAGFRLHADQDARSRRHQLLDLSYRLLLLRQDVLPVEGEQALPGGLAVEVHPQLARDAEIRHVVVADVDAFTGAGHGRSMKAKASGDRVLPHVDQLLDACAKQSVQEVVEAQSLVAGGVD